MATEALDHKHGDGSESPNIPLSTLGSNDAQAAPADGPSLIAETDNNSEEEFFVTGVRLVFLLLSLLVSIFCEALDETIIATAIPRITDSFHKLSHVGWYGSAYLLTNCAFQLLYGKLYQILALRWVFMAALFLFELGSLISAVAPTSEALIAGRAIAGLGAAGLTAGALNIMAHTTPLRWRPLFTSLIGAVYGIASVAGPLIGGAFAQRVTWRWNFYLNLPVGGAAALVLLLTLKRLPPSTHMKRLPITTALRRLDPIGTVSFIASIICLLIALQWGGTTYAWSSARIIVLLVFFAVLMVAFIASQAFLIPQNATMPRHMAKNRSMACGAWFAFCQGAAFNLYVFYLPLYFQAIKNASPITSGVDYLPLILINTVAILFSGVLTTRTGYYLPWIWVSSVLMPIGAGLLTLLRVDSSTGHWVGYQILFAIGSGFGLQQPFVTAQAVLPLDEISTGIAVMLFAQLGGGAIFVSVAQTVFTSELVKRVGKLGLAGLDPKELTSLGATQFRSVVPTDKLDAVLLAYNASLVQAYRVGLIMACLSVIGPLGMKWVNVKKPSVAPAQNGEQAAVDKKEDKIIPGEP
ncbi:MFS general substrate transporter [Lepidopterella palustris CBS 459.81]|uniref:MFS general substrate transporter n=1 Tax=Lepidopterella palustris CBS 459.81 TaxID=1314670 RepID=A0A8E2E114_9PEZI|nr:MFS general substrate transporter [Lepidopterella palustris CBS 459.81]